MRNFKVLTVLCTLLTILSVKTFAQPPLSDRAIISLLTCGPGEELYSVFGHTAIRVNDPAQRFDIVYNFGTFDFDTPNFYGKFVKGDLQYFVSSSSYEDFIYTYQYYNRDVYEQQLALTAEQKQKISNELYARLTGNERFYTYKFIHRNCTTMVADIINGQIPEKISLKNADNGMTYREIIHSRLKNHYFEDLGISLIFGAPTDSLSLKLFLPSELMQGVNNTMTAQGPLTKNTVNVFEAEKSSRSSTFNFNSIWTFAGVCLLLILFSGNKVVQRSFLAITGLLGVFFCCVGLYSLHQEITYNYNVLMINPLFLILLYFTFTNKTKTIIYISYICFAMLGAYMIIMIDKPHLVTVMPLLALTISILIRILIQSKRITTAENATL